MSTLPHQDFHQLTPVELLGPLNEVEQKHAPQVFFVAGDLGILEQGARVSIVGSREARPEGIRSASRLASVLVKQNVVIVSGLAEGIDTTAHTAAIKHTGRTIAVIGTPLDEVFPKQNAALQEEIRQHHLLISQFPEGTPVLRKNFPSRNRTMALLSDATVIIEASDTSGSLAQGREALRLGRPLFITKSVVEDASVKWPEELLYFGARILSDQTLEELFDILPVRSTAHVNGELPF